VNTFLEVLLFLFLVAVSVIGGFVLAVFVLARIARSRLVTSQRVSNDDIQIVWSVLDEVLARRYGDADPEALIDYQALADAATARLREAGYTKVQVPVVLRAYQASIRLGEASLADADAATIDLWTKRRDVCLYRLAASR
jgi:hypothetical protein